MVAVPPQQVVRRGREFFPEAPEHARELLGRQLDGAEAVAAKCTDLADAEDQPSPAVIVGLKNLANLLLGKPATPGGKGKKKREREAAAAAGGAAQGEPGEGSAKKAKKGDKKGGAKKAKKRKADE